MEQTQRVSEKNRLSRFSRKVCLRQALTHSSYANEHAHEKTYPIMSVWSFWEMRCWKSYPVIFYIMSIRMCRRGN